MGTNILYQIIDYHIDDFYYNANSFKAFKKSFNQNSRLTTCNLRLF